MPKATAGTPKAIANAAKAKGLGRLRWYCQVCEKQCRDDNGFKCHVATEAHLRQMLVVGEQTNQYIDGFSKEFMDGFMALLSRRYNTKRVQANAVYQEYIQDKNHIHMNATKWITLTEFVKHLGKEGLARVDETEKGWFLSWVDSSPAALARQEAILKKERQETDDEQRQRKLLAEQIARARQAAAAAGGAGEGSEGGGGPTVEQGLVRPSSTTAEGGGPVKLAFSFGGIKKGPSPPPPSSSSSAAANAEAGSSTITTSSSSTSAPAAATAAPAPTAAIAIKAPVKLSFNPLKRPAPSTNVLKSSAKTTAAAAASSASARGGGGGGGGGKMSATELLMKEDAERKRRLAEGGGGGRGAFGGGGGGVGGGKRLKM